jgi:hypothetical protein
VSTETLTHYTWADSPALAWGLVHLCDGDAGEWLTERVHATQEDAERADADKRMGATLYRVERTSMLADESTPAPQGDDWVFTYSTPQRAHVWTKPNCYSPWPDAKRFDDLSWTFPEPAEPIKRAARANEEPRTIDSGEMFRAYLLTWSVQEA